MRSRSLAAASLAALALALPGAADASTLVSKDFHGDNPVLAGDQVLFQDFGLPKDTLLSVAAGRAPRVVLRLPTRSGNGGNSFAVAASDRRFAFVREFEIDNGGEGPGDRFWDGFTAPLASPSPLADVTPVDYRTVGVGGDRVGWFADTGKVAQLMVRDFSVPGSVARPIGAGLSISPLQFGPAMAGRFAAIANNGPKSSVVVYDLDSGAEVLRTPRPDLGSFALDASGTVITWPDSSSCNLKVSSASLAAPAARVIPLSGVCPDPAIGGGRVVAVVQRASTSNHELVTSDLAGNTRVVAAAPRGAISIVGVDDSRIAWTEQHCDGNRLEMQDIASTEVAPAAPAPPCPLSIGNGSKVSVTGTGKVIADLRCPSGCPDAAIRFRLGKSVIGARDLETLTLKRTLADVKLTSAGRKAFARRGSLGVTLTATTHDLDGRRRVVSKKVTLTR